MTEPTHEEVARPAGFVSYVHKDNADAKDHILQLMEAIAAEFSLLTGEELDLFIDRTSIQWGDMWRDKIDRTLQDTAFFIPIITPRFFRSQECRNELLKFSTLAKSLGADDLLLPILFVDVQNMQEDSDDEAVALVAKTQYVDWRQLRLTDSRSQEYRQAVNMCARRLADVNTQHSSRRAVALPPDEGGNDEEWDESQPGLIDMIAEVEEKLPFWQEAISALPEPTNAIGEMVRAATGRMREGDAQGKTLGYKILLARDLSKELEAPAEQVRSVGERYVSTLLDIDPGVRAAIAIAEDQKDEGQRHAAQDMFESLLRMIATSRTANINVANLINSLSVPAKQYKDLRRPLNAMRAGLRSVLDAQAVYDEWEHLILSSPLAPGARQSAADQRT